MSREGPEVWQGCLDMHARVPGWDLSRFGLVSPFLMPVLALVMFLCGFDYRYTGRGAPRPVSLVIDSGLLSEFSFCTVSDDIFSMLVFLYCELADLMITWFLNCTLIHVTLGICVIWFMNCQ